MGKKCRLGAFLVAAALLPGLAGGARAQEGPAIWLVWSCRLANDRLPSLHCAVQPAAATAPAVQRNNPLFDQKKYLRDLFAPGAARNLARLVRADRAAYGSQQWIIPLFSPPIDKQDVRRLALAVTCGSDPLCVVEFEGAALASDCGAWLRYVSEPASSLPPGYRAGRTAVCVAGK